MRNLYDLHVALELCHQNYQRQFLNTEVPDRSRCHTPKMPDNREHPDVILGAVDSPRDHVEQALLVAAVGEIPAPGDKVLREQP